MKTEMSIEIDRLAVGNEHELMEGFVSIKQRSHHQPANSLPLIVRMNEHVREIDNEMPIRDCIADADELRVPAGRDQRV